MRAIIWTTLNGTWYGVLARAGQPVPENKPNYGHIIFIIEQTNSIEPEKKFTIQGRLDNIANFEHAHSVDVAKAKCVMAFDAWLKDRGLLAQIDIDYERVFSEVRGYWRDLGGIAEALGAGITYDRILAALKLLIAEGRVEVKEGGPGLAPTYRATLI